MWTGRSAPALSLDGVEDGRKTHFDLASQKGQWTVVVFYPADFSFVCPTEVTGFSKRVGDFAAANADVVAISTDPVSTHEAWAKELGGVAIALLSDPDGAAIRTWGAEDAADASSPKRALRATYIVDPKGVIAWAMASSRNIGRSVSETLRVLEALQTGRMCPADWEPGDPTGAAE